MNVENLGKDLDSLNFPSASDEKALRHLCECITGIVAATQAEHRQLTWSERNLLASSLRAMEQENWLLARAFIWNAIQLDGKERRVFGDEHRARLVKLTPRRLLDAVRYLCQRHRLPETFHTCAPPHVPHART